MGDVLQFDRSDRNPQKIGTVIHVDPHSTAELPGNYQPPAVTCERPQLDYETAGHKDPFYSHPETITLANNPPSNGVLGMYMHHCGNCECRHFMLGTNGVVACSQCGLPITNLIVSPAEFIPDDEGA